MNSIQDTEGSDVDLRPLYAKLWDAHVVAQRPGHPAVLYVDLHLIHDGTYRRAFELLAERGLRVARPARNVGIVDHGLPTVRPIAALSPAGRAVLDGLVRVCDAHGIRVFGPDSPQQGIVHVVAPELGLARPGMTIACADSHTTTHGALGALAFAVGTTQVCHVLASQCVLQRRASTLRIELSGTPGPGVGAKDVILALLARHGVELGKDRAIEYAGPLVRALSVEQRMTLCNMSAELGTRIALIAPDDATLDYLHGRPFAPAGAEWDAAVARWRALRPHDDARYDARLGFDVTGVAPMVSYGISPAMAVPIDGRVPEPAALADAGARRALEEALAYMALEPGRPIAGRRIDRVFIGSCTNARIEDLRAAASVLRGRRVADGLRLLIVPGSQAVRRQAEDEGLAAVFAAAGAHWGRPGCSLCVAMNEELAAPGEYVASTSNRNFRDRQGPGARTFLMGPLTAAATAVRGCIADPRPLLPQAAEAVA